MGHAHDYKTEDMGDGKLIVAVVVNALLTIAQVIGGVLSGSLSLISDALHNLSDAASLGIALFARKISYKSADEYKTFGYKRAEVIAALINLTTLIIIGLYLIYEALWRFAEPEEIEGWTVVIVASIALVIDIITAVLTYTMSKKSMNIKAAFLHNVSDALASVGVIIAGTLILLYGWYWVDTLLTLIIAGYVLWQGFTILPKTIHLLMEGTPEHLSIKEVIVAMEAIEGVKNVHHVHIWQLDEHHNALEAHVVVSNNEARHTEKVKNLLKTMLSKEFDVGHSTLEFEYVDYAICNKLL
ncbi:MAG: cation transporter [Gammaproteobacteria bacterium]|nr:MAG: cation transporter [Gammaproteobacteria bacterium]